MRASNRVVPLLDIIEVCERQGYVFEASREVLLGASLYAVSVFKTGSKPVILFSREVGYDGVGINAYAYRDPTISDYGLLESTVRNANDINPKSPTAQIYVDPTYSDIGVETRAPRYLFASTSNQSAGSSLQTIERPQLILPNKDIILVLENRDSNNSQSFSSAISWAEPDRIAGLVLDDSGNFVKYYGVTL